MSSIRELIARYASYVEANLPLAAAAEAELKGLKQLEAQAKAFAPQMAELRRDLRWVGHTVHRAHHEGAFDECTVHTCDAIKQALAKGGVG